MNHSKSYSTNRKGRGFRFLLPVLFFLLLAAAVLICLMTRRNAIGAEKASLQEDLTTAAWLQVSGKETALSYERSLSAVDLANTIQSFSNDLFADNFHANAAYVEDQDGNVLFSLNEHDQHFPASMTKLMTALVAAENTPDLDKTFTVADLEGCYEPDSMLMDLQPGTEISMRDVIHAILMCSYNDCATAIAMQVGGSLDHFAEMMNQKAQELGLTNTHFVTPHGLHDDDHYTCAYDMTQIMKAAYQNDFLRDVMSKSTYDISYTLDGQTYTETLTASSNFLNGTYSVPSMTYKAGKTGFTYVARSCLASVFEKDGTAYYGCVMDSWDASYNTMLIYDNHFDPLRLYQDSQTTPVLEELVLSTTY